MMGLACHNANAADAQLVLAKTGWLYVGGHVTTIDNKQYTVGQMYAEYMIPAKQTHPYPVVMVHGGTMSGTNYTGTPDGREGWAQLFARAGYAVYIVDQVGKGRSALFLGCLRSQCGDRHVEQPGAVRRARKIQSLAAGASAYTVARW
jgi:pimeloyl-ACP methyl ester carboxylesterase